jgi:hypothetical protein
MSLWTYLANELNNLRGNVILRRLTNAWESLHSIPPQPISERLKLDYSILYHLAGLRGVPSERFREKPPANRRSGSVGDVVQIVHTGVAERHQSVHRVAVAQRLRAARSKPE